DVQMPEMDGLEATRQIRARWPEGGPRIIALTANAMAEDRAECLAAGMDDYLSKPLRPEELLEALRRCAPHVGADTGEDEAASASDQAASANGRPEAPAEEAKEPAIDRATFDQLLADMGGDPEFMREVVDTFLRDGH